MKKALSVILTVVVAVVMLVLTMVSVPSATITDEAREAYEDAAFPE